MIRVDPASGIDRNQLIEKINDQGIGTSVHYKPLHRMTHWSKTASLETSGYPNADSWYENCLSLPLFPSMKPEEFESVCAAVKTALANCLNGASRD